MAIKPQGGEVAGVSKGVKYPPTIIDSNIPADNSYTKAFDTRWERSKRIKQLGACMFRGYVPGANVRVSHGKDKVLNGTILRMFSGPMYTEKDPTFNVVVEQEDGVRRIENHTVYSCTLVQKEN